MLVTKLMILDQFALFAHIKGRSILFTDICYLPFATTPSTKSAKYDPV